MHYLQCKLHIVVYKSDSWPDYRACFIVLCVLCCALIVFRCIKKRYALELESQGMETPSRGAKTLPCACACGPAPFLDSSRLWSVLIKILHPKATARTHTKWKVCKCFDTLWQVCLWIGTAQRQPIPADIGWIKNGPGTAQTASAVSQGISAKYIPRKWCKMMLKWWVMHTQSPHPFLWISKV